MPSSAISKAMEHLRNTLLRRDGVGVSDGQLLERYIETREEAAFEILVRRHGPMVWGVCRRIVGSTADADDAFQATFLVLVRKAASVVPRHAVGNWLYGVACRTSLKARAAAVKQRAKVKPLHAIPEPAAMQGDHWDELLPLLDRELSRLPDKYRLPVVLCELEGRNRKDVAAQLDIPEGTLSSRLATARKMLAKRLTSRGVAVSATMLAGMFAEAASAGVPATVMSSTLNAATLFAAGNVAMLSVKVVGLMEGVMKAMLMTKLKWVLTLICVLSLFGFGGGLLTHHVVTAQSGQTEKRSVVGKKIAGGVPRNDADAIKQERIKFEGTWQLIAMEAFGKKSSKQELLDQIRLKMTWLANFEARRQPYTTIEGMFQSHDADGLWKRRTKSDPAFTYYDSDGTSVIDPANNPKTIDLTVTSFADGHEAARKASALDAKKGQIERGIYEFLDKDTYRACYAAPGKKRPPNFVTTPENQNIVWVFQRVKPADSEEVKRLEGEWRIVESEREGVNAQSPDKDTRITIAKDAYLILSLRTGEVKKSKLQLASKHAPKWLDLTPDYGSFKGQQLAGIYAFDKDRLKICIIKRPDRKRDVRDRPKEFKTVTGDSLELLTLERVDATEQKWRAEFQKAYSLKDGEVLKYIAQPYPECREKMFDEKATSKAGESFLNTDTTNLFFRYQNNRTVLAYRHGYGRLAPAQPPPASLAVILDSYLQFSLQQVDAPGDLLGRTSIDGEFVFRSGTPPEKWIPVLDKILRTECKLPIKLTLKEVEREVIVVSGKYQPKLRKGQGAILLSPDAITNERRGMGNGSLDDLVRFLNQYANQHIISEVKNPPTEKLWWAYRGDGMTSNETGRYVIDGAPEPEAIFKAVAEQTGLTFTMAKRKVQVLFVENAD